MLTPWKNLDLRREIRENFALVIPCEGERLQERLEQQFRINAMLNSVFKGECDFWEGLEFMESCGIPIDPFVDEVLINLEDSFGSVD